MGQERKMHLQKRNILLLVDNGPSLKINKVKVNFYEVPSETSTEKIG